MVDDLRVTEALMRGSTPDGSTHFIQDPSLECRTSLDEVVCFSGT
jgi:hypothetical protein